MSGWDPCPSVQHGKNYASGSVSVDWKGQVPGGQGLGETLPKAFLCAFPRPCVPAQRQEQAGGRVGAGLPQSPVHLSGQGSLWVPHAAVSPGGALGSPQVGRLPTLSSVLQESALSLDFAHSHHTQHNFPANSYISRKPSMSQSQI